MSITFLKIRNYEWWTLLILMALSFSKTLNIWKGWFREDFFLYIIPSECFMHSYIVVANFKFQLFNEWSTVIIDCDTFFFSYDVMLMQCILLRSFWIWIHVSVVRPIKQSLTYINCTLLSSHIKLKLWYTTNSVHSYWQCR